MKHLLEAFKEKLEPGNQVEMWSWPDSRPIIINVISYDKANDLVTYTYFNKWTGDFERDEFNLESAWADEMQHEWLRKNLEMLAIYNSPLGKALR